ncbi:MAG: tetratricopeptide repeat protein [Verrucomicrobiales bacterium]|nr:tetratricopeptide repeat protein [Verrucomicrobiales bacterium]
MHDRANVLANLGDALRLREEDSAAEAAFRESLRLNPRREETRFRLAEFLYQQNRPAECLALLDASRESSARVVALRGQACQRLDRLAEARRHYEAALSLEADCGEALYGLLSLSLRLGDDTAAAEYQRRFAALKARQQQSGRSLREQFSPLHITRQSLALTHTAIGWVYAEGGETSKAEATWRRAAELDPSHTACRFHLMMLLQKTGRNPEALRLCEELIRLEPGNAFHRLSLGNLQVRQGATEQAATAFQTAHKLAPQRPETCFALAQFYLRNNTNLTEAVELAQQAVNLAPVAPHYYILSRLQAKTSAPDAARAAAVRATELDPDNRDYREWRAALEATP